MISKEGIVQRHIYFIIEKCLPIMPTPILIPFGFEPLQNSLDITTCSCMDNNNNNYRIYCAGCVSFCTIIRNSTYSNFTSRNTMLNLSLFSPEFSNMSMILVVLSQLYKYLSARSCFITELEIRKLLSDSRSLYQISVQNALLHVATRVQYCRCPRAAHL